MKKYLISLIASVFLITGCSHGPITVPVIEKLEPQISAVSGQAKKTTSSAERTVEYANIVENKFKGDKDTVNTVRSAKETLAESRETENQLAILREKGKRADETAVGMARDLVTQGKIIKKTEEENRTLKEKIKDLYKTIWNQRLVIFGLGAAFLLAAAFVIKPWKWFI